VNGMTATGERPYSILITDDDPDCRAALRDIVEPQGFRTYQASCGEEAVEIARFQTVHAVLCDMHMPTLTGLETIQLLRQLNALLPCILVTADATEGVMRQALTVRVYSVIPKPVSKNVVLYTVLRAVGRPIGSARPGTAGPEIGPERRPNP